MTTTDDNPLAALPARLRALREHFGQDVRTFAAFVGLSHKTSRAHEAGTAGKIRTGTMMAISGATGCSIDWLCSAVSGARGRATTPRRSSLACIAICTATRPQPEHHHQHDDGRAGPRGSALSLSQSPFHDRPMILQSTITCPQCSASKTEPMPTDACIYFYDCTGCGAVLKPKAGDCCVFCSFGDTPCPPIQAGDSCCGPPAA